MLSRQITTVCKVKSKPTPRCQGEACLIRFADDFVCAFEREEDARRFYEVLGERLGKFKLEL